ncbi:DUF4197 domain-containing protein [Portibacter marinus]|uniref:DUF4197 domain-containing protein n=1 Tax=Portibacter marinus TaxID=2898660 RepID=UPI001F1EF59B|nr:DUF4197 domain-containing protein [Portibacter marinus]
MRKLIVLGLMMVGFWSCDQATLQRVLDAAEAASGDLTSEEIANGLKQALDQGVDKGVQYLSSTDGFYKTDYKIFLPEEAQKLVEKLELVPGFQNVEEVVLEKINHAAEDAVKTASPIFVNAIRTMTINDAMGILMGDRNAATMYLNAKTYDPLVGEFEPVIVNALNKYNALDYWEDAVNAYNKIPFVQKMNPRLEQYITQKALVALFDRIEREELNIRENISARTTDLLRRVFARQD